MDYRQLDALIDSLDAMVNDQNPQKGYWKALWAVAAQINSGFRETRYQTRSDKDVAWQRFQELRDAARARSEECQRSFEAGQKQWAKTQECSQDIRLRIEGKAIGAMPMSELDKLIQLPGIMAAELITRLLGLEEYTMLDAIRCDLQECGERLKQAWEYFGQNKDVLLPADRAKCYEALQDARKQLDYAWAEFKQTSHKHYRARHEAWERKQHEFRQRVEANIAKLDEKLEKARSALSRQEAHLEKLRENHAGAWSDSFKERCSEWISEGEDRISDINESIERMEGWLREERAKLG